MRLISSGSIRRRRRCVFLAVLFYGYFFFRHILPLHPLLFNQAISREPRLISNVAERETYLNSKKTYDSKNYQISTKETDQLNITKIKAWGTGFHKWCLKHQQKNTSFTLYADKHWAKKHVQQLIPNLKVAKEFAFVNNSKYINNELLQSLPKNYVVKATHLSGGIAVVQGGTIHCVKFPCIPKRERSFLQYLKDLCAKWLNTDYSRLGELYYRDIHRKCMFEEYLGNDSHPLDYKIFTYHGVPYMVELHENRFTHYSKSYFTPNWNHIKMVRAPTYVPNFSNKTRRPVFLEEMLHYSKLLAQNFTMMRIDFMAIGDTFVFSEYSPSPSNCDGHYEPLSVEKFYGFVAENHNANVKPEDIVSTGIGQNVYELSYGLIDRQSKSLHFFGNSDEQIDSDLNNTEESADRDSQLGRSIIVRSRDISDQIPVDCSNSMSENHVKFLNKFNELALDVQGPCEQTKKDIEVDEQEGSKTEALTIKNTRKENSPATTTEEKGLFELASVFQDKPDFLPIGSHPCHRIQLSPLPMKHKVRKSKRIRNKHVTRHRSNNNSGKDGEQLSCTDNSTKQKDPAKILGSSETSNKDKERGKKEEKDVEFSLIKCKMKDQKAPYRTLTKEIPLDKCTMSVEDSENYFLEPKSDIQQMNADLTDINGKEAMMSNTENEANRKNKDKLIVGNIFRFIADKVNKFRKVSGYNQLKMTPYR